MNANVDIVVQDLCNQVANLSREKAIYFALATEKEQEVQQLRKELEELKKESPAE